MRIRDWLINIQNAMCIPLGKLDHALMCVCVWGGGGGGGGWLGLALVVNKSSLYEEDMFYLFIYLFICQR